MKKVLMILSVLMVMFMALCGCTPKTDDQNLTGGDTALPHQGEEWGFIFEQLTNPNYVTMSGTALEYCESLGIKLQIVDGQENSDTIINAAENMATLGYNVILLSPMSVEVAATATEAAKAIKPDIIVVNSANQIDACDYSLLQDDYTSGVVCGEYAAKFALENNLNEAILIGYPRDQALIDRENGFIEGVASVSKDIEVHVLDYSNYSEFTAPSENAMTTYPECRVVYAISDVLMGFFYETLQASGKDTSEWALYAVDGTKDGVAWLYENSGFRGTADTGTLEIPQGLVDAAIALEEGKTSKDIKIELPVVMITTDNVDDYAKKIGYEK